ncbi:MAG: hypothetical protein GTO63_20030 [Anaerolineae bacterium]|nr:hypothetical protein [Anaerolineae bacterium]NIN97069.1 hypothetical protein [Anaerolineae bacterium]NIQ80018.1 hypothetical protein [Anaerolineae bacterium]
MSRLRVAVNGYGVIGKRVADAVASRPDMEFVGADDIVSEYRVRAAAVLGLPVYALIPERSGDPKMACTPVAGSPDDLLAQVDVVVDWAPRGIGARNLERYRAAAVKDGVESILHRRGCRHTAGLRGMVTSGVLKPHVDRNGR